MSSTGENQLGPFLKARRAKLDPVAFGFPSTRRRTPGLRREEVAQRANVSATWYTWLEQGRGGIPSTDVLDRIAHALTLSEVEREHLFLLAQRRPPEVEYHGAAAVSAHLQQVLDAMLFCPAFIKNSAWDIVAWNVAATAVLMDYAAVDPRQRNILRVVFDNPVAQKKMPNWESVARFVVAVMRADVARAGMPDNAIALIHELSETRPLFANMWRDHEVRLHSESTKLIQHAEAGMISLDYSAFAISGQPDLSMIVYTPATAADEKQIKALVAAKR